MIVNRGFSVNNVLHVLFYMIFTGFLTGCHVNNVGLVGDAARAALTQDVSPAVKEKLNRISLLTYAQVVGIFPGRLEVVFLLAKGGENTNRNAWIGGGGISLVTDGPFVISTDGLVPGIAESDIVKRGSISDYLSGRADFFPADNVSVQRLQDADSEEWLELTGQVVESKEVFYQSEVFTGLVKEVTEKISVKGSPVKLRRVYWIEPKTRSLLRVEGDLTPELTDVVLFWLRVPANTANSN